MAALSAPANVNEIASAFSQRVENFGGGTLGASVTFYPGCLCVYDVSAGTIIPGTTDTGLIALGRYEGDEVVNTASADAPDTIPIRCGIFRFANSGGGDVVDNQDVGAVCYIVDDNTVMITASGKSVAGKVVAATTAYVDVAVNPFVIS